MAPACLAAIYEGDNGGSSARGVSSTEIRVAVPIWSLSAGMKAGLDALFEHVNQRFELYGRRIVPVYVVGAAAQTALAARTTAADLASQGIFAALTGLQEIWSVHTALPIELARQGVVTITRGAGMAWSDRMIYDALHPYVWSVYPSAEDVQANLADFSCTALTGHPARFAGDPGLQGQARRFGVIAVGWDTAPSSSVLNHALADCSGAAPLKVDVANSGQIRTALEQLKAQGATTVVCVCEDDLANMTISTAHAAGFYPEWLLMPVTWSVCEVECWFGPLRRNSRAAAPIMVNAGPRLLPLQARPWFGIVSPALATFPADSSIILGLGNLLYASVLSLASGIQSAGPNLSPDTFAAALMATAFPNPGAGQPPYWQAGAGFGPGDHSFYDDYHVAWWSDTAESLEPAAGASTTGSWCYLRQAARFRIGSYPADADARLFNPAEPCR